MSEIERQPTQRIDGQSGPPPRDPGSIPEFLLQWDRYVIKRRLGTGGMGEVFEAWDPRLGRFVAIKFLGMTDPDMLERFEREARAQARVDHPAICKVFEVGEVAGRRYIAMQEIHGVTLDQVASSLSLEGKIDIVRQVAEAIHAAHRLGLIHRDLKPPNILIEQDEDGTLRPYIVDFGLARDQSAPGATIAGTIAGTVGYMSPEQARGRVDQVDRRTDVYNLGLILYELVTGRAAFAFDSMLDALTRLQVEDVKPPRSFVRTVPVDVETIVMKALERNPERRYHSAHAMAEDLRRFLDGEPIVARRSSPLYRVRTRLRKHRLLASVVAAALLLLAIAGAWAMRERWRGNARAELAQRFGMDIKEIDLVTRVAGMLPAERAVPVRTLVLPRMQRIREEMRRSGTVAEGPGSYALARGSIALGDYRAAWEQLEAARRAKYDTPDVHYARGQVLGQFYEEALARAATITEAELRNAARASAVRRYREPAIEELRLAANATTAPPELLRAQLALREERLDDAIAAARRAASSSPWLYEAVLIEVASLRSRALALADGGKFTDAAAGFAAASERLQSAIAVARGDAAVHFEDCQLRSEIVMLSRFTRRITEADVAEATAPCAVAARLDPMRSSPWTTRGVVHYSLADDRARHGDDPTEQVRSAIAMMRRAIALDPNDTAALYGIGRTEQLQARYGMPRGVDPRPLLEDSRKMIEKAIAADPQSASYRLSLANTFLTRAEYEHRIGNDSRPWLTKAIEQGRRALQSDPDLFLIHNMLLNTYNNLGDREMARGGDPRPALGEATKAFERAVALNPAHASLRNNHGNTWLTVADHRMRRNEPAEEALAKAIASYRKAIELRPDYTLAWINIGYANRMLGQDRVQRGLDPMPAIAAARHALARYLAANPGDTDAEIELARAALVEARWVKNPARALAAAETAARRVLSVDAEAVAAKEVLAEVERLRVRRRGRRRS